jgi:D-alanyl-D-alanine carboxypeptidase
MKKVVGIVSIAMTFYFVGQISGTKHQKPKDHFIAGNRGSAQLMLSSGQQPFSNKIPQSLVEKLVRADQFCGVVSIAKDGYVLFERAYGLSDQRSRVANRLDTKFVIASVTQTFTAVAIAQLVARGSVSLDAPLSEYLPNYSGHNSKATVRQLLLHTAGIADVSRDESFRRDPRSFRTLTDYLTLVQSRPVTAEPGAEFRYSNGDCVILGAILEKVSGESYYDYIGKHVFRMAGMRHSGFDLYPRPGDLATGYTSRYLNTTEYANAQKERHDNQTILPTKGSPGVAAYSTARDLIHFGNGLLQHQLLNEKMTNELLRGRVNTGDTGPRQQYGFGFFDGRLGRVRIVNHGGTGPGIDVGFDLYPELGYVVVVMSNYDPPAAQRIRDEIRIRLSSLN